MSDVLLPCPFCGGKAYVVKMTEFLPDSKEFVDSDCYEIEHDFKGDCPLQFGRLYDSTEQAIRSWNMRAE